VTLSILILNRSYFAESLRRLGHRVVTAAPQTERFEGFAEDTGAREPVFDFFFPLGATLPEILARCPKGFAPDRLVYHDDSNPIPYLLGLDQSPIPTLFYSVDCHLHFAVHPQISGLFDQVLCAQADYVPRYARYCQRAAWFPLWARYIEPLDSTKTIDACFRGNLDPAMHPQRATFFAELQRFVPINVEVGPYRKTYASAKIVVNHAVREDLNFRVFEILGCGALAITPNIGNGMGELFTDGQDIVTYRDGDAADAAAKIQYYLQHEDERARIAAAGYNRCVLLHSEDIRARQLEEHLLRLQVSRRPRAQFGAAYARFGMARLCRNRFAARALEEFRAAGEHLVASFERGEIRDDEVSTIVHLCERDLAAYGEQEIRHKLRTCYGLS